MSKIVVSKESLRIAVFARDGGRCFICAADKKLHCHHIRPEDRSKWLCMKNAVTLCAPCHRGKAHSTGTQRVDELWAARFKDYTIGLHCTCVDCSPPTSKGALRRRRVKHDKAIERSESIYLRARRIDYNLMVAAAKREELSLNAWAMKVLNAEAKRYERQVLAQQPTLADLLGVLTVRGFDTDAMRKLQQIADRVLPEGREATRKLLPAEVETLRREWMKMSALQKEGGQDGKNTETA